MQGPDDELRTTLIEVWRSNLLEWHRRHLRRISGRLSHVRPKMGQE